MNQKEKLGISSKTDVRDMGKVLIRLDEMLADSHYDMTEEEVATLVDFSGHGLS